MIKHFMSRSIFFLFLFLFILASCSSGFDYEREYEEENYQKIIDHADSELSSYIRKTPLYYKMISHYRLNEYSKAVECAQLYYAMYNDEEGKAINDALSIMLYHSDGDVEMSVYAGEILTSSNGTRADDYAAYFIALMDGRRFQQAADLYNEIRSSISSQTASFMCIAARASSTLIVSNLEAWYMEDGYSDALRSALFGASALLSRRGDGLILLPLAQSCYESSGNGLMAVLIGDIYIANGETNKASVYYSEAYEEYPQVVQNRISRI